MGILVINFGAKYPDLIVKKIRSLQVFSDLINHDSPNLITEISRYDGIILIGDNTSKSDQKQEKLIKNIIKAQKPILAIDYAMLMIHKVMKGIIGSEDCFESGNIKIQNIVDHIIINGIPHTFNTWMSHNDSVLEVAPGFTSISKSEKSHVISINDYRKIYTVLFHPEEERCAYGDRIISNFLFLICKVQKTWVIEDLANAKIDQLKDRVANNHILIAVSGGLNSAVTAKIIQKSCPNSSLIYIETGLSRAGHGALAIEYFRDEFKGKFHAIEAQNRFLEALKGVIDPEEKIKVIGKLFSEIFGEFLNDHKEIKYLALGTTRSDLLECDAIKEIKEKFQLIEPMSDLFKSEVRKVGRALNLPEFIINEHPFPGTGYATRIMGEVTEEKLDILRRVDEIFIRKIKQKGVYYRVSQAFAILLSDTSIGIVSGKKEHGHVIALRSVDTNNFISATPSIIPTEILIDVGDEITNLVPEVSRVVYDLTAKPPAIIEWE